MTYFAGVDVSRRTVNICLVDAQGNLADEAKLASDVQEIAAYRGVLDLDASGIVVEAGARAQELADGLQSAGREVICRKTRQVNAALSAMRNKTDQHDTRGTARLPSAGW